MNIRRLEAENFRNLKDLSCDFAPGVNVICGANAQGKTNLLESVHLLSTGRSWRTRQDRDLINFDADFALLRGEVAARERDFTIDLRLARGLRKSIKVNGVMRKVSELPGYFTTVLFSPEDLELLRAGAAVRRRFLDTAIAQLRPRYAEALGEYQRLLEHKTRILKDGAEKPDLLAALPDFERRMVETGSVLIHYRAHFVRRIGDLLRRTHADLSGGEHLAAVYHTVSTVQDPLGSVQDIAAALEEHLRAHRAAEAAAGLCLSGPHKDDLEVLLDGRSVRSFGSQGQTRTAALSLKLAELGLFAEDTGEAPVLLLDDVLSELDEKRRAFVVDRITGGQVIITCCDANLPGHAEQVLRMENGRLIP